MYFKIGIICKNGVKIIIRLEFFNLILFANSKFKDSVFNSENWGLTLSNIFSYFISKITSVSPYT